MNPLELLIWLVGSTLRYEPTQFAIMAGIGTLIVVKGTEFITSKAERNYGFDPEGNIARTYGTAIKSLAAMATGIASAIKAPSIISAIPKAIAAITGTGS